MSASDYVFRRFSQARYASPTKEIYHSQNEKQIKTAPSITRGGDFMSNAAHFTHYAMLNLAGFSTNS